jgi:four helix bundle protein
MTDATHEGDPNKMNYEKLEVRQKANAIGQKTNIETRPFPSDERFGLTNQLRRAATSVSSNIAEGSSRSSKNEFARFTEIAAGSLFEVVSQSFIARRQQFLNEATFRIIYAAAEEQSRMLSGLRRSLITTV